MDVAGFNLAKTRRRGRNVIGQRAVVNVPGQRGGNITLCAAISVQGVLHHHATLGPYNTGQIIAFLDALHAVVQDRPQQPRFVVIWDNVSLSILTQPSPYLCENIDIVVTVCVFSNTIQYFLLQTVLDFDAGELPHEFI